METNIEQNKDTNQAGGITHGFLAYLLFFVGIVLLMIVISYVVKWLMG